MKLSTMKTFCNPEFERVEYREPFVNTDSGATYVTALDGDVFIDVKTEKDVSSHKALSTLPHRGEDSTIQAIRATMRAGFEGSFIMNKGVLKKALETAVNAVREGSPVTFLGTTHRKIVLDYYDANKFETEFISLGEMDKDFGFLFKINPVILLKVINVLEYEAVEIFVDYHRKFIVIYEKNAMIGVMNMHD